MWLIILFVLEEIKVKMQVILEILYLCLFLFLSENEIYMLISVILPFNILNFMDYTTIKPLQELLVLFVFCLFRKFNSHFQSSRINKKKKKTNAKSTLFDYYYNQKIIFSINLKCGFLLERYNIYII
jgi:hypothetical protein